jgi:MFS family permease
VDNKSIGVSQNKKSRLFYGYIIVIDSFLMMVVCWVPYYAFGVFFTPMLTEFGWTRAMTSGTFSASQIIRGLGGIVMGRLNDKIGPRKVLTVCALLMAAGYLTMNFIHSLWQFYLVFAVLLGMGLSGFWVPVLSTVARWFVRRRATMSGLVLTGTGVGTLIGAPLATLLLSIFDWRTCYLVMGIGMLLIMPALVQLIRREPREVGQFPDGDIKAASQVKIELTGRTLKEAARSLPFWLFCCSSMAMGYCTFSVAVHIVPHAIEMDLSPGGAAGVLAVIGGCSLIGRLIMGDTADRIGERQVLFLCFIVNSLAFLLLVVFKQSWMLFVFAVIIGIAQGMGSVGSPLLADVFGLKSHGLIFGVANNSYTIGAALGPFITGFIFDISGSYQGAFTVCLAASLFGLLMSGFLRRSSIKPFSST